MAEFLVNIRIDDLENAVIAEMSGPIRDDLLRRAKNVKQRVQDLIRERAEISTPGGLADSIEGELFPFEAGDEEWSAVVFSTAEHAIWFEQGTGELGPRGVAIVPRGSGPMIFTPRGMSRTVAAFKVVGQPPHEVFKDGIDAFSP